MRLWHKDLLDILPDQILVQLWKDCCEIAKRVAIRGSPKDWCVNRVINYPMQEFWAYSRLVCNELGERRIPFNYRDFGKWQGGFKEATDELDEHDIFSNWHNRRYLWQCYSELEEMLDCGLIREADWPPIADRMADVMIFD